MLVLLALLACSGGQVACDDVMVVQPVTMPSWQGAVDAGYRSCDVTTAKAHDVHRVAAIDCELVHPTVSESYCERECPDGQLAVGIFAGCKCITTCTTDSECGDAAACVCVSAGSAAEDDDAALPAVSDYSQCVPANCSTDADCGDYNCSLTGATCDRTTGLYCHTEQDECQGNFDCPFDICRYAVDEGRWMCTEFAECD